VEELLWADGVVGVHYNLQFRDDCANWSRLGAQCAKNVLVIADRPNRTMVIATQ